MGSDTLFPPLPGRIRIPFARPPLKIGSILRWYCTPGLATQLVTRLSALGIKRPLLIDSAFSGLVLALQENEIGKGDEVIIPSFVCKAVVQAVLAVDATPVFVDCDKQYNPDPASVRKALTGRTRAVIAVHQYGVLCDIEPLRVLCRARKIVLIDDAAVPLGLRTTAGPAGTLGDAGVFSTNMGKTVVAFGGGVVTGIRPRPLPTGWVSPLTAFSFLSTVYWKQAFAPGFALLRALGLARREEDIAQLYAKTKPRRASPRRMSRLQQAAALSQLTVLSETLASQRKAAALYSSLLADLPQLSLPRTVQSTNTYYVIEAPDRYALAVSLARAGIETQWTFYPLHLQPPYKRFARAGVPLRRTDAVWKRTLSLPMFSGINESHVRRVSEAIHAHYAARADGPGRKRRG